MFASATGGGSTNDFTDDLFAGLDAQPQQQVRRGRLLCRLLFTRSLVHVTYAHECGWLDSVCGGVRCVAADAAVTLT